MKYQVVKTEDFKDWFAEQTLKSKVQIDKRIAHIQLEGHFGTINSVEDGSDEGVFELKWRNGRRVYYGYIEDNVILLLYGGNKNGQSSDIKKAYKIFKQYTE